MKVKLLISRAGVGFSQNVGDIIEVPHEEGMRMIKDGQAVAVPKNPNDACKENPKKEVRNKK